MSDTNRMGPQARSMYLEALSHPMMPKDTNGRPDILRHYFGTYDRAGGRQMGASLSQKLSAHEDVPEILEALANDRIAYHRFIVTPRELPGSFTFYYRPNVEGDTSEIMRLCYSFYVQRMPDGGGDELTVDYLQAWPTD